jgi:hypothetical protein
MMAAARFTRSVSSNSTMAEELKALCGPKMPWGSGLISEYIGTGNAAIEAGLSAWDTAENQAKWTSEANGLGIRSQKHPAAEIDVITPGEVLFIGARTAYWLEISTAPVDAQDMTDEQIEVFVSGMVG